eukprot:CAMPEP_0116836754 /NCGR_PEP_ID=MMETSP0418-20121206/8276_1 /TAXON_ID=1158023 /ORGANISM="Astrosyne radiata, Strain 13vi08-1A" /LENGTH=645 /DNA_ID=CAMNT_0004466567 /DNA_START=160 /DNA_END=2097 /DNA_ORIENTATION=+
MSCTKPKTRLRYVKERGFHTAHIWSCPPSPGDDYIFHCHPSHQLIPRDDMLRSWYLEMLEKAKNEGVVLDTRTVYDEYFKNSGMDATAGPAADPTCLPYFEGDYISGEVENIIRELNSEEEAKRKDRDGSQTVLSMNKKVGKKLGTRSNPGELVNIGQDKVMLRLGQAMNNMRQNFIVVHLRSRAFAGAVERGEDVSGWVDETDDTSNKRTKIGGKDSSVLCPPHMMSKSGTFDKQMVGQEDSGMAKGCVTKTEGNGLDGAAGKPSNRNSDPGGADQVRSGSSKSDGHGTDHDDAGSLGTVSVSLDPNGEGDDDPSSTFGGPEPERRNSVGGKRDQVKDDLMPISLHELSGGAHAQDSGLTDDARKDPLNPVKRGFDEIEPTLSRHFAALQAARKAVASTEDEDEPQEVEMFESRQQFLNYCQTNHFQFDELRRAKHTTMMLLFQLHNPNAPKFLQQCGACYREITHGFRYRCNMCSNFDLCEECYEPVMTGKWAERDPRFAHDQGHTFSRIDAEATLDEQKSREERSRTIKAHLELLAHAASCSGPPSCSLSNCQRMKKLFDHVKTCEITPKKACKICTRVLTLLSAHARTCTVRGECPLPFCDRVREKMKRRRQQQQLMDDRRREAQNQLYRGVPGDSADGGS